MALYRVFACLAIILTFNNFTANAAVYTYITNKMVEEVYTAAGYTSADYVQRWVAEGNAIQRALKYLHEIGTTFYEGKGDVEFIFASTSGHACSYIYGQAERLANTELPDNEKPSKFIVVYTLNYLAKGGHQEFLDFKEALNKLIDAGKKHDPQIEVVVKNFRPGENGVLAEVTQNDDMATSYVTKDEHIQDFQLDRIDEIHTAVNVERLEIIVEDEFKALLTDMNIKTIVDAIVGCEHNPVTVYNQIYLSTQKAQIRIMATAILERKKNGGNVMVVCLDNPSGMSEIGIWQIAHWYNVDIILSYVWHKELVNTYALFGNPKALVLDIEYKSKRLIDELWKIIPKDPATTKATTKALLVDVDKAIASSLGVFTFAPDSRVPTQMVVV